MRSIFLISFLLFNSLVIAQQSNPLPVVQNKMQALKNLAGKWHGTSKIKGPDGKEREYKHSMDFKNHLNNTVLLLNESLVLGQDTVAKNIGLFGYDASKSKYNLQAYTNDGVYIDAYLEVLDKQIKWRIHHNGHIVRYTATVNNNNQWLQTGEVSADEGKTWQPFFESTLKRL